MPTAPDDAAVLEAAPGDLDPTASEELDRLRRQVADLRAAVSSRERIGIATGLLAHRFRCSPDQAWQMLVQLSQVCNVKLRVVALTLIDEHCSRPHEDGGALSETLQRLLAVGPGVSTSTA